MKKSRRIISVLSAALLVATLASCDANRNTKMPSGDLKLDNTYASIASGQSVSVKEMYNLFRKEGYSKVLTQIKKALFSKEMEAINDSDFKTDIELKKDFDTYMLSNIYGVSEIEDYEDLDENDKKKSIQKFIDAQLTNNGIDYSSVYANNPEIFIPTVDSDGNLVSQWANNSDLVALYKYTVATVNYAKAYLNVIKDYEYLYDVDGEKQENSYYLAKNDYEVRESKYSQIQNYTTTADLFGVKYNNQPADAVYKNHAIVIKFASKAQADKYINIVGGPLSENATEEEALAFYVKLYNEFYKNNIIEGVEDVWTNENTSFEINEDENEFTDHVDSAAISFMTENLVDMGSDKGVSYLSTPFNISGDNYYYMAYRINIYEGEEWEDLELSDEVSKKLNSLLDEKAVEDWASETYANQLVEQRLQGTILTTTENGDRGSLELKIYDPIYENQYYNSYSDYYDFISSKDYKSANGKYVFTLEYTYAKDDALYAGQTVSKNYSVNDSYNELNNIYGASKAAELLATKYLSSTGLYDKIEEETISGYEDGLKDAIKNFKKNDTSYSKKMGLENYLVLQYGFDNQRDVLNNNLIASSLISQYTSYYGDYKGEKLVGTNAAENKALEVQLGAEDKYLFNDNTGLFTNFKVFADRNYDMYYSLDISHILISIDYDGDGNNDDPDEYYEALNDVNKRKFKNDILTLADAIVEESKLIKTDTKVSALQYIAKVFNNNGYDYKLQCTKYKGMVWDDFKSNFEFSLRAEDLSTIDNSNGSNYVEEFTDEVKNLYKVLKSEAYGDVADDIEDNGYWKYEDTITPENQIDINGDMNTQLTKTTYGWHMLYVYDMTGQTECKFTRSNDSNLSSSVTDSDGNVWYVNSEDKDDICIESEKDTAKNYTKITSIGTWQYQDIVVYEHDTDTSDDDEILYVSGYSEDEYASLEQLFIYFIETQNNGSVSSLRSTTTTAVKNVFADVITRYTNETFQTWRLYKQIGTITFAEESMADRFNKMMAINERTIDSYEELTEDDLFYGWFTKTWTFNID